MTDRPRFPAPLTILTLLIGVLAAVPSWAAGGPASRPADAAVAAAPRAWVAVASPLATVRHGGAVRRFGVLDLGTVHLPSFFTPSFAPPGRVHRVADSLPPAPVHDLVAGPPNTVEIRAARVLDVDVDGRLVDRPGQPADPRR